MLFPVMRNSDLRSHGNATRGVQPIRLAAIPLAMTAGLVAATLPANPALADYGSLDPYNPAPYRASTGDYRDCAAGLKQAGIAEADIASACGAALYPRDISTCVTRIGSGTAIAATDALSNCRRVRRPVELATCVVDISKTGVDKPVLLEVLDSCRRSLIPRRFSNCVVGLRGEVNASITDALTSCIAASNRPRAVLPSFEPAGGGVTQPSTLQEPVPPQGSTPLQQPVAPSQNSAPTQQSTP
jgi:hypothetical protein